MQKAEIDALVRAHRGRARPVAFFHILRQESLGPADHAFLEEHIDELSASDLLRWRARCAEGFTAPVIQKLARMALEDPAHFEHEVLNVPRLELHDDEWTELADLLRGKVKPEIFERVLARCRREPVPKVTGVLFTPGVIGNANLEEEDGLGPAEDLGDRDPGGLPLRELLRAWLAGKTGKGLSDDQLVALATARARGPEALDQGAHDEDWGPLVRDLPAILQGAVIEKAKRTPRGAERANLLQWLGEHGAPRAALLELALLPVVEGDLPRGLLAWLARELRTRAAWEKHGFFVVSALLGKPAIAELAEIVTITVCDASSSRDGEGEDPPRGLLEAVQVALALGLVGLAREALDRRDEPKAMAALSALACLDPPSRVSRAVHDLVRTHPARGDLADLMAVNERLVKHGDARDASLEGVVAALHALADASG